MCKVFIPKRNGVQHPLAKKTGLDRRRRAMFSFFFMSDNSRTVTLQSANNDVVLYTSVDLEFIAAIPRQPLGLRNAVGHMYA